MWGTSILFGLTLVGVLLLKVSLFLWPLYFYLSYVVISIVSLIVRIGIEKRNKTAMWIDTHVPNIIRLAGLKLSETIYVRVLFWFALLAVGWLWHDSQEYHNTFVLWNVDIIEKESANNFWMQRRDPPVGQVFPFYFCNGSYVPNLQVNDHVEVVVYTVGGVSHKKDGDPVSCFSITNGPLGIAFRRPPIREEKEEETNGKWQ